MRRIYHEIDVEDQDYDAKACTHRSPSAGIQTVVVDVCPRLLVLHTRAALNLRLVPEIHLVKRPAREIHLDKLRISLRPPSKSFYATTDEQTTGI